MTVLHHWTKATGIDDGPLLRPVSKGNRALARRLNADSANLLVQQAIACAGLDPLPYSAHSLRAGFVTYAHFEGPATAPSRIRPATAPSPRLTGTCASPRPGSQRRHPARGSDCVNARWPR